MPHKEKEQRPLANYPSLPLPRSISKLQKHTEGLASVTEIEYKICWFCSVHFVRFLMAVFGLVLLEQLPKCLL